MSSNVYGWRYKIQNIMHMDCIIHQDCHYISSRVSFEFVHNARGYNAVSCTSESTKYCYFHLYLGLRGSNEIFQKQHHIHWKHVKSSALSPFSSSQIEITESWLESVSRNPWELISHISTGGEESLSSLSNPELTIDWETTIMVGIYSCGAERW